MAFLAKLTIDGGEDMNVLNCSYRFTQSTDSTGKPTSIPHGGYISLVVESTKSTDIFDWMINATGKKNGVITFYRRDMHSKLKTLDFGEAYCIDYQEMFDHKGEHPMQISFTISAKKIKLNDSEFENNRPDTEE
jgi:Hemolysin coregulated protein Hcp (TssD)